MFIKDDLQSVISKAELAKRVAAAKSLLAAGKYLPLHNCSMCDYECKFFQSKGQILYDPGCYCAHGLCHITEDSELIFYVAQDVIAKKWGII
jgi:hypothetical protein